MSEFYHVMNEYTRITYDLSNRFNDAVDFFNENEDSATDEELAECENLKRAFRDRIDENAAVMINVPSHVDLTSNEGLAILDGTKDNCLNKLADIVNDMEELANDVSGGED